MKNLFLLFLCLASLHAYAQTDLTEFGLDDTTPFDGDELMYDGDPLDIVLKVDQTTRLVVDFDSKIGLHPEIKSKVDDKSLPSGVFITALEPFAPNQMQLRSTDGKRVIPITLSAITTGDRPDKIRINDLTVPVTAKIKKTKPVEVKKEQPSPKENVAAVLPYTNKKRGRNNLMHLIQISAQSVHGAARLREELAGAIELDLKQEVFRLIPGGRTKSKIIKGFQLGNYYSTIVKVFNKSHSKSLTIDPTHFVGYWRYAGIHESNVIPPRSERTVYLISDRPFDEAYRGVVSWRNPS